MSSNQFEAFENQPTGSSTNDSSDNMFEDAYSSITANSSENQESGSDVWSQYESLDLTIVDPSSGNDNVWSEYESLDLSVNSPNKNRDAIVESDVWSPYESLDLNINDPEKNKDAIESGDKKEDSPLKDFRDRFTPTYLPGVNGEGLPRELRERFLKNRDNADSPDPLDKLGEHIEPALNDLPDHLSKGLQSLQDILAKLEEMRSNLSGDIPSLSIPSMPDVTYNPGVNGEGLPAHLRKGMEDGLTENVDPKSDSNDSNISKLLRREPVVTYNPGVNGEGLPAHLRKGFERRF